VVWGRPSNPLQEHPLTLDPAPSAPSDLASLNHNDGPNRDQGEGRTPLEELVLTKLDDEKAQDIVFINLKYRSAFADGLIIASGRSHRHVGAMADHLLRALKEAGHGKAKVEGLPACDWVLIDAGDLIVHLFRPEVRSFYNIEKIWSVDSAHLGPAH
jgi:ribosome-associated protein